MPVQPATLVNGLTTWINDSDNVLRDYKESSNLGIVARTIKAICPPLFHAIYNNILKQAIQNSRPRTVIEIDCGSGEPSARILSFKNDKVTMTKKIEVNWNNLDKTAQTANLETAEIGFIAELIKECPNAIFDIRATAWARLAAGEKEFSTLGVERRLSRLGVLNSNILKNENVRFRVISQAEEGEGANLALHEILRSDPVFARGLNPARAKAVDGGNRSNQGADFAVGFGAADVRKWVAEGSVKEARDRCHQEINASFEATAAARAAAGNAPQAPVEGQEDVPFFAGSHLFALTKNEAVLKKLDINYDVVLVKGKPTIKLTDDKWHEGISAPAVLDALNEAIEAQTTALAAAGDNQIAKDEALNDLKGLIVTAEIVSQYIKRRGTKIIRVGEYVNAQGQDVKLTHYFGGYIKDFAQRITLAPNYDGYGQRFLRKMSYLFGIQ